MRQTSPLDEEGNDARQLLENVILIHGTLEILLAAAAAGPDPRSDHAPNHLQVAITEGGHLFVDFDQGIEQAKREAKERLVPIKHDEERGPQRPRRKIACSDLKKHVIELLEEIRPFIAFRKAG